MLEKLKADGPLEQERLMEDLKDKSLFILATVWGQSKQACAVLVFRVIVCMKLKRGARMSFYRWGCITLFWLTWQSKWWQLFKQGCLISGWGKCSWTNIYVALSDAGYFWNLTPYSELRLTKKLALISCYSVKLTLFFFLVCSKFSWPITHRNLMVSFSLAYMF